MQKPRTLTAEIKSQESYKTWRDKLDRKMSALTAIGLTEGNLLHSPHHPGIYAFAPTPERLDVKRTRSHGALRLKIGGDRSACT